jgi:hypothetical protein
MRWLDRALVCFVLLALLAALPAKAQRAIHLSGSRARVPGSPEVASRAFLRESGFSTGVSLRFDRLDRASGLTIARFSRTAFGGEILGSRAIVRFARDGSVDYASIGGELPLSSVGRVIDRERARRAALDRLGASHIARVFPAALAYGGVIAPVWVVDARGDRLHERSRVIVDARTASVLFAHSRLEHAMGRVYAQNPVSDEGMTSDVELSYLTSRDHLTGRYFRLSNCAPDDRGCDSTQLASADEAGDFLYDPEPLSFDDPFAEVHTYHHANAFARYLRDVHGFTWSCGGSDVMRIIVNYVEEAGRPYDNAGFVPSAGAECGFMIFGQGTALDFSYDADVIYHEVTHSVVDGIADLEFFATDSLGAHYEPAAVNEGLADYFAATFSGDPVLAEYFASLSEGELGLRVLDHDLACPRDLVGESHYDGRLFAGLAWELREILGPERADALMFATLSTLEPTPSLADATDVLTLTADSFALDERMTAEERASIESAIDRRGLRECERIVALDDGAEHRGYSGDPGVTGSAGSIAPVHYRIDVPADARALHLSLAATENRGRYRLYVRRGEPVLFEPSGRPMIVADASYAVDGELTLGESDEAPLARCTTLHFAIQTEDLAEVGPSMFTIRAELTRGGALGCEEPDAGPPAADAGALADAGADAGPDAGLVPAGGGCGCRAAPRASDPAWIWLALILLARRRLGTRPARL